MQGSANLVAAPAPSPPTGVRALRALQPGSPDDLRVHELDLPRVAAGSLVVAVTAAGVNRSDTLACRGIIPCEFPRTLGRDFAGVVVDGPRDLLGVRVWGSGGGELGLTTDGTHATHVVVACDGVARTPDGLTDVEAAASALGYFAAHSALALATGVGSADPTSGLEAGERSS